MKILDLKNVSEIKNLLNGFNKNDRVSELESRLIEIISSESEREISICGCSL